MILLKKNSYITWVVYEIIGFKEKIQMMLKSFIVKNGYN